MASPVFEWLLPALVFAMLPVVGLAAGPAYAPLAFGLGAMQFLYRTAILRRVPRPDAAWLALALLFAGLCWASILWSIVPARSLHGAVQATAVLLAALILVAQPPLPDDTAAKLMRAMAAAYLVGGILIACDTSLGYPLQRLLTGGARNAAFKYNRGTAYALLLAWPVLGRLCRERAWGFVGALGLGLLLMLAVGLGLTARLAAAAATCALALAWLAPRLVGTLLAAGASLFAITAPALLRLLARDRAALAPYLKASGQVRLEIWSFMTARVFAHPLGGSGFWSANALPNPPPVLRLYFPQGVYPHDQWLQLWVELGVAGAALGVAAIMLTLRRVRALPAGLRPFGYAAFAAAMTISLADFDLATDSWWAALAACAYLFKIASSYARPDALRPSSSASKE